MLDEVALEDEGFELGVDNHPFDVADVVYEPGDAVAMDGGGAEIAADAGTEVNGLSDIEDVAGLVAVDVTAGLGWELFEFFRDVGVGRLQRHRSSL